MKIPGRLAALTTLALLAPITLAGCGSSAQATAYASASAGSITVSSGWVAAVPGAMAGMSVSSMSSTADADTAAYATITNASTTADSLVSVSTPAAGSATLSGRVAVPAHGSVTLAPGSARVLLAQLDGSYAVGTSLTLTWRFRSGATVTAAFPVIDPADRPGGGR